MDSPARGLPLPRQSSSQLNFDTVPVALEDLVSIYEAQTAAGHTDRLQTIEAPKIIPYDLEAFRSFSKIASTSLVHLMLGREYQMGVRISAMDLLGLSDIIKSSLPNLTTLSFAMHDVEAAEAVCGGWLEADALELEGSILQLEIFTRAKATPLYSTLRFLARCTRRDAGIKVTPKEEHVGSGGWYDDGSGEWYDGEGQTMWGFKIQNAYLRYLRRQPAERRRYLATVNFRDELDITAPEQVLTLTYREDGRPTRRLGTQAAGWGRLTTELNAHTRDNLVNDLQDGVAEFIDAARTFQGVVGDRSSASDLLAGIKELLAATERAERMTRRMTLVETVVTRIRAEAEEMKMLLGDDDEVDEMLEDD